MHWTPLYLSTPIPQVPKTLNDNFTSIKNYLDVFYDGSLGIVVVPIETTGRVKATRGEFVTAVVDNLTVKNQYTNLYENITTADFDYYSTLTEEAFEPRDACAGWPYEDPAFKWIDVNKPYYKITNEYNIALTNNNISQIVGIIFDSSLITVNDFNILLDPSGNVYTLDPSLAGAYVEFIMEEYDPSWGSTWARYQSVLAEAVGGATGIGGVGTAEYIPKFTTSNDIGNSALRMVSGVLYGDDISVGDVIIHNALRDSSENILVGYGSPMQINDPNADRDVSIYGSVYVDGSLNINNILVADLTYVNGTFVKEVSLGPQFSWVDGSLYVDTSAGEVTFEYVDGSLAERDASLQTHGTNINNIDSSIDDLDTLTQNLDSSIGDLDTLTQTHTTEIANLETSVGTLDTLTVNLDSSVGDLDTLTQTHTTQIAVIDGSIAELDSSVTWLYENVEPADLAYIDGSLAERDVSIQWLTNNTYTRTYIDGSLSLKADQTGIDASLQLYVPYTGAMADVSLGTHGISIDNVQFDTTPNVSGHSEGRVYFDTNYRTLSLNLGTESNLQIGQENLVFVKNNTGSVIPNGKAVYISGVDGGYPTVALAKADNIATSKVAGLSTENINPGNLGYITNLGVVHDVSTNQWATNTRLFLSSTSEGEMTSDEPDLIWTFVGTVLDPSDNGSILTSPQTLTSLTSLSDVLISSPATNQVIAWNGVDWINANIGTVSPGGGVSFFFLDVSSDIPTYETIDTEPEVCCETVGVVDVSLGGTPVVIDIHASPSTGLLVDRFDGGIWEFNTYASVSKLGSLTGINMHVYKRDYLGNESSLFSTTTGTLTSLTPILIITTSVQPTFVIDPSDRLIIKNEAYSDSVDDVSVSFYHGGTEHYSYVNVPISTKHNDLGNIQGGSQDERYHLTLAQKTVVGNTSGVNSGDQNLTPYALIADVDTSISDVRAEYIPDVSLGTGFAWNTGLLDVSIGTFVGNVSIGGYLTVGNCSSIGYNLPYAQLDVSNGNRLVKAGGYYGQDLHTYQILDSSSHTSTTPTYNVDASFAETYIGGTYKITASMEVNKSNANGDFIQMIEVDGASLGNIFRSRVPSTTSYPQITKVIKTALTRGTHSVALRSSQENAGTFTIRDIFIEVIRIL